MALGALSEAILVSKGTDEGRRGADSTEELEVGAGAALPDMQLIVRHYRQQLRQEGATVRVQEILYRVHLAGVYEVLP